MLLAVLSVQHVHTLSLIDFRSIPFTPGGTYISIFDDLKVARSRPRFVTALPGTDGPDPLGVVSLLKWYDSLTTTLRPKECLHFFISYCKPHRGVSSDSLSHWIRRVMSQAGIDTNVFGSHSVRGVAASAASHDVHVSLDSVLAAGDWSSTQSFSRHYVRPVGNLPSPSVANALMRSFA